MMRDLRRLPYVAPGMGQLGLVEAPLPIFCERDDVRPRGCAIGGSVVRIEKNHQSQGNHHMTKSREIVFVDQNVSDLHSLLAGLRPDVEPIVLTASERATTQIATALKAATIFTRFTSLPTAARARCASARVRCRARRCMTTPRTWPRSAAHSARAACCCCGAATRPRASAERPSWTSSRIFAANVAAASGRVGSQARGGRWDLDKRMHAGAADRGGYGDLPGRDD